MCFYIGLHMVYFVDYTHLFLDFHGPSFVLLYVFRRRRYYFQEDLLFHCFAYYDHPHLPGFCGLHTILGSILLIFKTNDANDLAFHVELFSEIERVSIVFFDIKDRNLPREFDELNCTFVEVHDLCSTWGPLLYMSMMEFLRCPLDSNSTLIWNGAFQSPDFLRIKDDVRRVYSFLPFHDMPICFVISISISLSSLLMTAYRRFVTPNQWFDTQLRDFVERPHSSVSSLLSSLITDFLPTFLRFLFEDYLSIR
jgi:hypothetical protein